MAKKTNTVNVAVTADAKKFRKEFDKASKDVGKFQQAANKAFKAFAKVGIGAAIGVGAAIGKAALDFQAMEGILIKGTGASGAALEDLKTQAMDVMKTVPESAATVAGALADVNTHLGLTGDDLEETSRLFLDFARVTGVDVGAAVGQLDAQLTQFGLGAEDTEEVLGDLIRISQATGAPMEKLLKQMETFGPIFANAGFSVEETAAMFGQLEQAGVDVTRVGPALNKFFRDTAAAGEDPKEALEGITNAIAGAETSADALNIATEAFGSEGAQRMVSAIQSGNFELETFGGLMGEGTGIVEEQAIATQTLSDKFNILKNKVLVALGPIAIAIMDAFMGALDKLMPFIDDVIEGIEEFVKTEEFQNFKDTVVDVLKTVGEKIKEVTGAFGDWIKQNPETFLKGLSVVIGGVLLYAVYTLTAAVWGLIASFAALFTPVTLTVAAVLAIIAVAIWAYTEFETFRGIVDGVVDVFQSLWDIIKGFAKFWWDLVHGDISGAIDALSDAFGDALERIIGWFTDTPEDVISALSDGLWRFVSWGADVTTSITDGIGDIAGKIKQKIMDLGGSIWAIASKMKTWGTDLGRSLINGIIDIWNRADLKMPRVEVPSWVPKIGGKGFGGFDIFPPIDALAAGGLVTGPQLSLIGEAGPELVIPLDRLSEFNGGGGRAQNITINVTGVSGEEVIEAIRRETQRRGAAVFPTVAGRRT